MAAKQATAAQHDQHPSGRFIPRRHHRDVQGGAIRAAIFGVSDGLVTNVSLILGDVFEVLPKLTEVVKTYFASKG